MSILQVIIFLLLKSSHTLGEKKINQLDGVHLRVAAAQVRIIWIIIILPSSYKDFFPNKRGIISVCTVVTGKSELV